MRILLLHPGKIESGAVARLRYAISSGQLFIGNQIEQEERAATAQTKYCVGERIPHNDANHVRS